MPEKQTAVSFSGAECIVEHIQCTALDDELPWRRRRVGFLLLDVEGHEDQALWGAASLIRRWLPIIASELPLTDLSIWTHLQPLGYRRDGKCPGLTFFTPAVSGNLARER